MSQMRLNLHNTVTDALETRMREEKANGTFLPLATKDGASLRRVDTPEDRGTVWRPAFVRDIDKIMHCPFYNRYADKTQVFSFYKSDDITHRGLHVQLVSRIARTIGAALNLNTDLIEAMALGHDIGHTPFGHSGEKVLDELYCQHTGRHFSHNIHSVRVLDRIYPYNLSLQTLSGIAGHDGETEMAELHPLPLTSFAEFERTYFEILGKNLEDALALTRQAEERWADLNPAPLFSGSFADCIANARDMSAGGCRYNQSGVDCAGLATAVDSLAAVRYLVEETKAVTMAELREILRTDWKGREDLRLKARNAAPKWGVNDDRADLIGKRIYDFLSAHVNAAPNGHGGTFQAGFWSINHDLTFGKLTAATPDGRRAGTPLSRNNSATAGCGHAGPTALLHSNAKLDRANAPDGHILDVILPASVQGDPTAAARIAAFLRVFAATGGQCIHLNVFNAAKLRDAQQHPDRYPDLQVRVCGWNVRWNDLSKVEQDYFIATAEAQERP